MLKKIGFKFSINTMLLLLVIALSYHLLIILEQIPFDAVWGGRLEGKEKMIQFEAFSITINMFMLLVILIKGDYIKIKISLLGINLFLWLFALIFGLNTIGNLFSLNLWEAIIFTPITFVSSILCIRLAMEK